MVRCSTGSMQLAIDVSGDDLGAADHELEAFAAHHFDQDGELQFAAAENLEAVRASGLFDANGDVGEQFFFQTLAQVARGDELAFASGHGRVVDGELHGDRRLVDDDQRQRRGIFDVGDGLADGDAGDAGDGDDVADLGLLDVGALESVEGEELGDLGLLQRAVALGDVDLVAGAAACR